MSVVEPAPVPFFTVAGGSPGRRRLLLVSLLFPPAQGVGALRWQKMARYVEERGWELDVITVHPEDLDAPDWSRLSDLPGGTRLFGLRTPVVPLARLAEAAWTGLRGIPAAPARAREASTGVERGARRPPSLARHEFGWKPSDPRTYVRAYNAWLSYAELERWAKATLELGRWIVAPGRHDAVVSSGPPHASHEGARRIARHAALPFVMDMRDLWSLFHRCPESIASPVLLRLARRYERRCVDAAALVVANTEPARSVMVQAYPGATTRIITVMNGFDDEPLPPARHGRRFLIAYAGSIYLDRDPGYLFRALRRAIDELHLSPHDIGIEFIGTSDWHVPIEAMAAAEGIGDFVTIGAAVPRAQAQEFLAGATMLVILPQDSEAAIPAKVFEYVRFDAWLLAMADTNSATELVLRGTGADIVPPRDVDAIAGVIRERYRQYRAGSLPRAVAADPRLSRRAQADLLLDALERCVHASRSGVSGAVWSAPMQEVAS